MPEELEVDTDSLREKMLEPPAGLLLRNIAVTTALLAALGAIASLRAGGTVNEALVLKTEAGRLQAEASDQWGYYQAKGIKATVLEASRATWVSAGKTPPAGVEATIHRYESEQAEIEKEAHLKEKERDAKSSDADDLLERHHRYADSVALIQVSIALAAVAALTRQRWIWLASVTLGVTGAGLFLITLMR